jgi:hypothetical protein
VPKDGLCKSVTESLQEVIQIWPHRIAIAEFVGRKTEVYREFALSVNSAKTFGLVDDILGPVLPF